MVLVVDDETGGFQLGETVVGERVIHVTPDGWQLLLRYGVHLSHEKFVDEFGDVNRRALARSTEDVDDESTARVSEDERPIVSRPARTISTRIFGGR